MQNEKNKTKSKLISSGKFSYFWYSSSYNSYNTFILNKIYN